MPPRFAYWTIIAGGLPTSFRAADRDDLLPTFRRIKEKHPDAEMRFFARGQLWESQEDARRALARGREAPQSRRTDQPRPRRGPEWRPGGEHRDPRQPFKDAKKARNQNRRQQRWEHRQDAARPQAPQNRPPRVKPHGDRLRDKLPRRDFRPAATDRFQRNQDMPTRPPRPDREPPPGREPKPEPPPRPSEPAIKPPGPPERGDQPRVGGARTRKRET